MRPPYLISVAFLHIPSLPRVSLHSSFKNDMEPHFAMFHFDVV